MHYYHRLNHAQRKKFVRRVSIVVILVTLVTAGLFLFVFFDNKRTKRSNDQASTSTAVTTTYFAENVQIFRTAYFQFQANRSWIQAVPETTDHKFVYRSKRGSLIEHELVIYVNQIPEDLSATRVLPVIPSEEYELKPKKLSDHCGKQVPAHKRTRTNVKQDNVMFKCHADSSLFTVLVGLQEGGTNIPLVRPDGSSANYAILYSNVTANPEGSQLEQIINTFQTR